MVTMESVEKQLKKLHFNPHAWGRAEVAELPHILLEHEEIFEVVNGMYEGGFALLVATNVRLLLVDKKPLNYLTVEDLRFDMINELDYSHRLFGANINISAGNKNLAFRSFNQPRLRKAIGHVQRCMAEAKKEQSEHAVDQKEHLAQINQQLQSYMIAQHQQQEKLREQLEAVQSGKKAPEEIRIEDVKPSPELSDYLFAQSLLSQARQSQPQPPPAPLVTVVPPEPTPTPASPQLSELYADGMREIFGKQHQEPAAAVPVAPIQGATSPGPTSVDNTSHVPQRHGILPHIPNPLEINPLAIAYSKLPLALRNRKFGRPSFHAHSQQDEREARRQAQAAGAR